ncbi:peroxidase TAP [Trametes gibbosa]|nr:peroxidase TAP [Trametes gibbosa]
MSSTIPPFDPANVQGDILAGLPKKVQEYIIFQIGSDVIAFRKALNKLLPLITTTTQVQQDRAKIAANKKAAEEKGKKPELIKLSGVNIAFSQAGLTALGITDDLGDSAFKKGQFQDSQFLGDKGTTVNGQFVPDWIPAFKTTIHGVILISGDCAATLAATRLVVEAIFNFGAHNATIHELITLTGTVRPGDESGHEHFGFLDGISQPAVKGIDTNPNPGQETVDQGVILLGRGIDVARPAWAVDGSFLALRYLFQLVPEFNNFLKANPIKATGLTPEQGSELLGARLVGRWKSGAPVDLAPTADDPALGKDPLRNNNFRYAFPGDPTTQERCPFAAHTRKTNPRADLEDPPIGADIQTRRIIRRGVQFGPEVTAEEASSGKTKFGRGLIFVAYQSTIPNGFQFIQHSWANATNFPPKQPVPPSTQPVLPGFDPLIGQTNADSARSLIGTDPNNQDASLTLPTEWILPRGGEYFFSPSLPALRTKFALSS